MADRIGSDYAHVAGKDPEMAIALALIALDNITEALEEQTAAVAGPDVRTLFAIAALTGLVASGNHLQEDGAERTAERAWNLADAMCDQMGNAASEARRVANGGGVR